MNTIEKLQKRIKKTQLRYAESNGDREWENENQIAIMEALIELLEVKNLAQTDVSGQFSASDMIEFAKFTNPSSANKEALEKWKQQKISR